MSDEEKFRLEEGKVKTWIVNIDSTGKKLWDKTLFTVGNSLQSDQIGLAIQTKEGCYAFANYTAAGIGGYKTQANWDTVGHAPDYWIVKFCDTVNATVPVISFISSDTSFCDEGGKCIDFFDQSTGKPTTWQWFFPGAIPDTSTLQNPTNICYYTPGTFNVTLIAANVYGSDTLTVSPLINFTTGPSVPVFTLSHDTIFCSHATSYQWYFNGTLVPGATDSFYVATGDGLYAVMITDGNGCSRLSDGFPVSINELSYFGGIKIYPNPAGKELRIKNGEFKINTIEICNVLGEEVYKGSPLFWRGAGGEALDVSALPKGVYVVQLSDGDHIYRSKFIKD